MNDDFDLLSEILLVDKPLGMTPLQVLDRLRFMFPRLKDQKLSYAGRLDPMASGLMLVLVGEKNKEREKYLGLDKRYLFEMILGFGTDSYDLLGLPTRDEEGLLDNTSSLDDLETEINRIAGDFTTIQSQKYPPYSSKPVDGKPLWWWAREGLIDEIKIPSRDIRIDDLKLTGIDQVGSDELLSEIVRRIGLVEGDFRQAEISSKWREMLSDYEEPIVKIGFDVSCTSGTYVRSLVNRIGEDLGTGAVTYSIVRTEVGDFRLDDAVTVA